MKRSKKHQVHGLKRIGIIAEDDSDIGVMKHLIGKIAKAPFSVRYFTAGGCGKIIGKANAWARSLHDQGCRYLLLVHDLDRKQIAQLRADLTTALASSPIQPNLIVIPIREIEAWLLADHEAISRAMRLSKKLSHVPNPEALQHPKEHLGRLIYALSGHKKRYVNSIHNVQIAAVCGASRLRRCTSYVPFYDFIEDHIQ
jgi:hypothetical protein